MSKRYVTLGDGRKIGLGRYVAAWKQCLALPANTHIGRGTDGWTWDMVEEQRAKWDIAGNMVPIATAHGVAAWGTINSVRMERDRQ